MERDLNPIYLNFGQSPIGINMDFVKILKEYLINI